MKKIILAIFLLITSVSISQGLKTNGKKIVDQNGTEVLLRGMGLGGWMLMEGYMMQSSDVADTQHEFRNKLINLIGEDKTNEFYNTWLQNHVTKKDIDSLAKWGFNSVRLPMHYNLFTLPIEDEPINGENTWLNKGFDMVDNLLDWCESNNMYLILDLHAAPGGQGTNAAISDYDENKPSLWESPQNKSKTVALWSKLADRYKDEKWIGGYDLINEVNGDHVTNAELKQFYIQITNAIREVDTNHIIFIEGHDWANNFTSLTPAWDDNMVYSFHKYWTYNDLSSIQWVLDLRENENVPLWMGEAGENSNVWFTEAITLFEENNIGWSWWPIKRVETIVGPYSIKFTDGYKNILKYWRGEVSKPSEFEAFTALMELANNTNSSNCDFQKDVPDAMIRQVATNETMPYSNHKIPGIVYMSDFDLGKNGFAYFDQDYANYNQSTGTFQAWNNGWVYRNDGVDVQLSNDNVNNNGYQIGFVQKGEWMNYTVNIQESGIYKAEVRLAAQSNGGQFHLSIDGEEVTQTQTVNSTGGWETFKTFDVENINLEEGKHVLRFDFDSDGEFNLSSIKFSKIGDVSESDFKALNGHTATNKSVEIVSNLPILSSSLNNTKDDFILLINGEEQEINSVSINSIKAKTIVLTTEKTIIHTDEVYVGYIGTEVSSQSGKTLETFSNLKIRNTLSSLFVLPRKIEAENFIEMFGLGLEETSDLGGGSNIGYTDDDDYADYMIFSPLDSNFQVNFRFSGLYGGEIGLYLVDENDNLTQLVTSIVPATGGWQTWTTTSENLNIPEGIHKLRLKVIKGGFNMNWMEFIVLEDDGDADDDGIKDEYDNCPNSEIGAIVDEYGCKIFTLPATNFSIETFGETCPDRKNGKIIITASEVHNYILELNGIKRYFTVALTLSGLLPGTYELCLGVEDEDFSQCYTLEIENGEVVSGKTSLTSNKATFEIMSGTPPFYVFVNEKISFSTTSSIFDLEVNNGDKVEVKSKSDCEGILSKTFYLNNEIIAFPNPTNDLIEIVIPTNLSTVEIGVYLTNGQLLSFETYAVIDKKVKLNLGSLSNGVYLVKLNLEIPEILTIIKN